VEVASQNSEEGKLLAFNQAGIAGWILWYLLSIIVYMHVCACVYVFIEYGSCGISVVLLCICIYVCVSMYT